MAPLRYDKAIIFYMILQRPFCDSQDLCLKGFVIKVMRDSFSFDKNHRYTDKRTDLLFC